MKTSRKSAIAVALLILCIASVPLTALVKGDAVGIGKYLTVNISGQGTVIATKSTGDTWTFNPPTASNKLGAGSVTLTAVPAAGWTFAGWSEDLTGTTNGITIKIDKYQTIRATFVRIPYTVTLNKNGDGSGDVTGNFTNPVYYGDTVILTAAPAASSTFGGWSGDTSGTANPLGVYIDGNKAVTATFSLKHFTITATAGSNGKIDPSGSVDVVYGSSKTFTFTPDTGYHVSAILVDGAYLATSAETFTFSNIKSPHSIAVSFSLVGQAIVPADSATVFLDSDVSLIYGANSGGYAAGNEITGFPSGAFLALWNISSEVDLNGGSVTIVLKYDPSGLTLEEQEALRIYRTETLCDVNLDGKIDGSDVSIVGNANPSAPGSPNWNPFLDVNQDGKIDSADVNMVNDHIGGTSTLVQPPGRVDTTNYLIYGTTSQFSFFGTR